MKLEESDDVETDSGGFADKDPVQFLSESTLMKPKACYAGKVPDSCKSAGGRQGSLSSKQ